MPHPSHRPAPGKKMEKGWTGENRRRVDPTLPGRGEERRGSGRRVRAGVWRGVGRGLGCRERTTALGLLAAFPLTCGGGRRARRADDFQKELRRLAGGGGGGGVRGRERSGGAPTLQQSGHAALRPLATGGRQQGRVQVGWRPAGGCGGVTRHQAGKGASGQGAKGVSSKQQHCSSCY
ncbi:hypothetical protein DAI22_06g145700 [Oryza sativa Japonica Group]|nr:hypothetical protein DAI22_06g145700 [Oryza sativa Japonica Group]